MGYTIKSEAEYIADLDALQQEYTARNLAASELSPEWAATARIARVLRETPHSPSHLDSVRDQIRTSRDMMRSLISLSLSNVYTAKPREWYADAEVIYTDFLMRIGDQKQFLPRP